MSLSVAGSLALPTKTRLRRGQAAAVQRYRQGHERAVAARLLAVPALGPGAHARGHALEVGVGQVVQGDGLAEAEEGPRLREQVVSLTVSPEPARLSLPALDLTRLLLVRRRGQSGTSAVQP